MMAAEVHQTPTRLAGILRGYADVAPDADVPVTGLAMDSRLVEAGGLFFACAGGHAHGLDYLREALDRGAAAVAWEPAEGLSAPRALGEIPCIAVPDLRQHVGAIAARFYGDPSSVLRAIGVTGTNGKSTVVHLLARALDGRPGACGQLGTLGYGLVGRTEPASHTTPDPVRVQALLAGMLDEGATHVAMEVSSHALVQGRVEEVGFTTAAFTNLSREHLDYHRDMEDYARSKARLFACRSLESAVVSADDPFAGHMMEAAARVGARILSVGRRNAAPRGTSAHMVYDCEAHTGGVRVGLSMAGRKARIDSPLMGDFNAANLAVAATVLVAEGMSLEEACEVLAGIPAPPGRMERWDLPRGVSAVVDYAHSPDALEKALTALRPHVLRQLVVVFGCGGERDPGKRPLMGRVAERLADRVVLTDDNPRGEDPSSIVEQILSSMRRPEAVTVEHDREAAIREAVAAAGTGDIILVAGKGHEDYQERAGRRRDYSDRVVVAALDGGGAT